MAIADIVFQDKTGLFLVRPQDNSAMPTDIMFEEHPLVLTIALPSGGAESAQKSCVHVV